MDPAFGSGMNANPTPTRTPPRAGIAPYLLSSLVLIALLSHAAPAASQAGGSELDASVAPAQDVAPLRIVVNVPAYRLDLYEGDRLSASYPVTIGKTNHPTPGGSYAVKSIIWNPWWRPPYHRRHEDRVTPPGPRNPMGKVKLNFTEMYYLHGTAKDGEIGEARSRGCVRLRNEDAIALAEIVHRYAAPISDELLSSLESTRSWRTHQFALKRRVPVEIRYDLAELRGGMLRIYPDVYHQSSEPLANVVARALAQAGYPWQQLDSDALQRALDASGGAEIPVATLLSGAEAAPATSTASTATPQ
jgi:lipoprotein-anchoring transpeptidase ErfK/SrfK